ncbi:MAG: Type polyketide synthase [Acidimicrobiaceae bacterium]|nr:Type polyketide synthase [Acidimicrobiaceae bacterium]
MVRVAEDAVLTGIASAFPVAVSQDELWDGYFAGRFGHDRLARAAFSAVGVRSRGAVIDPRIEDVSEWSTGRRMARYLDEALPLAKAAAGGALERAGVSAGDIGALVVTSCTGYVTPGLDVLLARDLGLAPDARRVALGHLGCHAALPALATAAEFVAARGRPALLVALELASLHLQPASDDLEQAVVHALFGDAAAAAVLEPAGTSPPSRASGDPQQRHGELGREPLARRALRLEVVDHEAGSDLAASDDMTWHITDMGFRMTLSRGIPRSVGRLVGPVVDRLLERSGLSRTDVTGWAVHPGGPKVLTSAASALGLAPTELVASETVLAERGNCSSATILLALEELCRRRPPRPGEWLVLLAFGPGLTCYGSLLRAR